MSYIIRRYPGTLGERAIEARSPAYWIPTSWPTLLEEFPLDRLGPDFRSKADQHVNHDTVTLWCSNFGVHKIECGCKTVLYEEEVIIEDRGVL
jgi:hypothetical protein